MCYHVLLYSLLKLFFSRVGSHKIPFSWLCHHSGQAGDENVALKFPGAEKEREAKPLGVRLSSEVINP